MHLPQPPGSASHGGSAQVCQPMGIRVVSLSPRHTHGVCGPARVHSLLSPSLPSSHSLLCLSFFLSYTYTHTHTCYNYSHKTLTQPRAVEAETKGIRTKALVDFSWEVKVHVLTLSLCWTETRLDGLGPTRRLEGQQPVAKWE